MLKSLNGFLRFEFTMFRRNTITAFFLLLFPTMMLLVFGSIYGNEPNELYGGFGSVDMFVPAYSGIVIAVTGLMNLPLTICEYREKGVFKRYKASPAEPLFVIISQLVINSVMTIVGMLILIVVGKAVYQIHITNNLLQCFFLFLLSIFCIFSIGVFIGGCTPNMKSANSISYLVFFPMLFFSGATIPFELFPASLQSIVKFLPLTHTVSAMKSVWNGTSLFENTFSIIVLFVYAIIFCVLSFLTFKWE